MVSGSCSIVHTLVWSSDCKSKIGNHSLRLAVVRDVVPVNFKYKVLLNLRKQYVIS